MFKRINNWHLSALVAIVSIFSLVLIQQYVTAQGWTDPSALPGGTPANNLVVTPMLQDLQLGGHDIADTKLRIDGNGSKVIQLAAGSEICFNGTSDCASTWAGNLWTTHAYGIYYNSNVGIGGVPHSSFKLALEDTLGILKLKSDMVWAYNTDLELKAANQVFTNNYFGIGTNAPDRKLSIFDSSTGPLVSLSGLTSNYRGMSLRQSSNDAENWFVGANAVNKFVVRRNGSSDAVTVNSNGKVGIGASDPTANLEIEGDEPLGSVNLRLYNTTGQDSKILFRGYVGTNDDFSIKWSGNNSGSYDNWLEFWGGYTNGNRPVMTMQRDYDPAHGQYSGVGIGVEENEQINTILRVKNHQTEDILQLYDNTTKVLTVADGGNVGINTASSAYKLDVGGSIRGTNYYSGDGTVGVSTTINTGTCTITVKNGLVTATTCAK